MPALPSPDQGQGGKRGQVRAAQHVAQRPLHRRRSSEPAGTGVVRRGGQRPGARYDASGAVGDAGRGAAPPGEAARSGHAGAVLAGGSQGVQGLLRELGRLPLWRALEVGGCHGAGGGAPGHRGDLVRRRAHRRASPGATAQAALHPARPVGRTAQGGWPAPQGSGGGADPIGEVERRSLDVYELVAGGVA